MVTHDPLEALRLGNRVIVLRAPDKKGAGRAAVTVDADFAPDGPTPRSLSDGALAQVQAELMDRLAAAQDVLPDAVTEGAA
jgi:putative hydroxymethylpyrimidine transport system ATP-binding protein